MRNIRLIVWAVAAIAIAAALTMLLLSSQNEKPGTAASAIGGPFELVDQTGATVTEAILKGHPSAIFFGYTHCPDVCPTTLFEATGWLEKLGADGDRLKVYFVTVDPERDTPEMLRDYLQAFDPRINALTGSREAIDRMIADWHIYAAKVEVEGNSENYLMDHTATVFLLDGDAQLVSTVSYEEDPDTALAKLKRLVDAS